MFPVERIILLAIQQQQGTKIQFRIEVALSNARQTLPHCIFLAFGRKVNIDPTLLLPQASSHYETFDFQRYQILLGMHH